ncbi:hypothetical protein AC1031_001514 [Aphanomyces cochlioides]|nr:hypothetical protein AC1031_001514 [Aphanomyces cochlioides]
MGMRETMNEFYDMQHETQITRRLEIKARQEADDKRLVLEIRKEDRLERLGAIEERIALAKAAQEEIALKLAIYKARLELQNSEEAANLFQDNI